MKYLRPFYFSLLAVVLALFDTSFFSFNSVYGATIISVFVVAILLSLISSYRNNLYYVFASVLAMSVFSSLPIPLIFVLFIVLPVSILYVRTIFIKEVSPLLAVLIYLIVNSIAFLLLLIYMVSFTSGMVLTGAYFVFLNTFLGLVFFLFYKRIRSDFVRGEVKFR